MAECTFCKTETQLYDGGVPVCVQCAEARDNKRKPPSFEGLLHAGLHQEFLAATERAKAATAAFDAVMSDIPTGLPHPDGTQRIHNASREVSLSRCEMMKAHNRLNDYLDRGIVPEDLKRSGS